MASAFADDLRKVLLRIGKLLDQLLVALRFFERIEVDPLHVLDNREFERFLVVDFADDDRHFVEAGALCRPPAALAGDDLEDVGIFARADKQGLHHTLFADRVGELVELVGIEVAARIGAVGDQEIDRQALAAAIGEPRPFHRRHVADQRREATPEP